MAEVTFLSRAWSNLDALINDSIRASNVNSRLESYELVAKRLVEINKSFNHHLKDNKNGTT